MGRKIRVALCRLCPRMPEPWEHKIITVSLNQAVRDFRRRRIQRQYPMEQATLTLLGKEYLEVVVLDEETGIFETRLVLDCTEIYYLDGPCKINYLGNGKYRKILWDPLQGGRCQD